MGILEGAAFRFSKFRQYHNSDPNQPLEVETLTFKNYIGVSDIQAAPCTRELYNQIRNWNMPKDENPNDEGYLIQVLGTKTNVLGMSGHVTWSPKEVFEQTYRLSDTFLDRLLIERDDLIDRIDKLKAFLRGAGFRKLTDFQATMLVKQSVAMEDLFIILEARIRDLQS
jgi:hypothetical protein